MLRAGLQTRVVTRVTREDVTLMLREGLQTRVTRPSRVPPPG
jgi:hypothetical protein